MSKLAPSATVAVGQTIFESPTVESGQRSGAQKPAEQTFPDEQVPQLPPQLSPPHTLPEQSGAHIQEPDEQTFPVEQVPQLPTQPSPPHTFPEQEGRQLPHFPGVLRSEEHTSELQSQFHLVCRLLLEKKNIFVSCSYFLCLLILGCYTARQR